MSDSTATHRLVPPEQTLARITPYLERMGITRCLDITGLDNIGIPVFCAVRPHSPVLQTSGGKGIRPVDARISALMESIELYHAETPHPEVLERNTAKEIVAAGQFALTPSDLGESLDNHFTPERRSEWVKGIELISGDTVHAPASAVYFHEPSFHATSTNGLASGNHPIEADLHALYELIERDTVSRLSVDGRLQIRERARVIDQATIDHPLLADLLARIEAAESSLRLLWLPSPLPVHTFWAVLLNHAPFSAVSTLNIGYGSQCDPIIAAARAITEAAQSRAIFIHGSREDIMTKPVYQAHNIQEQRAYQFFAGLKASMPWGEVVDRGDYPEGDLFSTHQRLINAIAAAGLGPIYSFDLTQREFDIPVSKLITPNLQFNRAIF